MGTITPSKLSSPELQTIRPASVTPLADILEIQLHHPETRVPSNGLSDRGQLGLPFRSNAAAIAPTRAE